MVPWCIEEPSLSKNVLALALGDCFSPWIFDENLGKKGVEVQNENPYKPQVLGTCLRFFGGIYPQAILCLSQTKRSISLSATNTSYPDCSPIKLGERIMKYTPTNHKVKKTWCAKKKQHTSRNICQTNVQQKKQAGISTNLTELT